MSITENNNKKHKQTPNHRTSSTNKRVYSHLSRHTGRIEAPKLAMHALLRAFAGSHKETQLSANGPKRTVIRSRPSYPHLCCTVTHSFVREGPGSEGAGRSQRTRQAHRPELASPRSMGLHTYGHPPAAHREWAPRAC